MQLQVALAQEAIGLETPDAAFLPDARRADTEQVKLDRPHAAPESLSLLLRECLLVDLWPTGEVDLTVRGRTCGRCGIGKAGASRHSCAPMCGQLQHKSRRSCASEYKIS